MDITIYILLIIVAIILIIAAFYYMNIPLIIFGAGFCMVIALVSFFGAVQTNEQVNLTQTTIDSNTIHSVYEYRTLNYGNDTGLTLIGWSSLAVFFLLIVSVFYLPRDEY